MHRSNYFLAFASLMLAPAALRSEIAILQLHVLQGEGAVFASSSRVFQPITVRVTDETGAPIAGAAVSFRLPEDGVTGIFQNGLKTDLVLSGPDGRAISPGITWGPLAGPVRLRITAALDQARAGLLLPVYVSPGNVVAAGASSSSGLIARQRVDPSSPAPTLKKKRGWTKWVLLAAAGAGAGVAFSLARQPGGTSGSSGTPVPVGVLPPLSIGQPTISVGKIP